MEADDLIEGVPVPSNEPGHQELFVRLGQTTPFPPRVIDCKSL
jgi:hypothetical protein